LAVRVVLRRSALALPPAGVERFCQRLLRESGFEEVTITGRSGDGGIDGIGILQVNPLVSFKVLFQCKRYAGSVTPSQVRDFRGAVDGDKLVSMLEQLELGLTPQRTFNVDAAFFDQFKD
jgi:restriction system protein